MKYLDHYKNWLSATGQRTQYGLSIKTFMAFCQEKNIEYKDITFDNLNEYITTLQKKNLTEGTINNYIKALRSFYTFLVKSKVVDEQVYEVTKQVKMLKVVEKERVYITEQELDDMIEMASTFFKSPSPQKIRAILYFMFYSGVRKSEIVNLKREDINLEKRYAVIKAPVKNKRERKAPFTKKTAKAIKSYWDMEMKVEKAFNISYSTMADLFERLKEFAPSGKNFTPHMLRTSFFYFLGRQGFNLREMQSLGGHSSIESTKRYYNPTEEECLNTYNEKLKRK
jgi:integrase/recombinase XerC